MIIKRIITLTLPILITVMGMASAHDSLETKLKLAKDSSQVQLQIEERLDSLYAISSKTYKTIEPILKQSCYNCHSNQTNFPWYYKIPIVKGIIDNDLKEAKKHLDMSDGFPFGGHASQYDDLKAMEKHIEESTMPPASYVMMHWDSKISGTKKDSVLKWIKSTLNSIDSVSKIETNQ